MYKFLFITLFIFILNSPTAIAQTSTTTTIILSPHFDDAVLPLGGMLAQANNQKKVITVFSGKPEKPQKTWWDLISGFLSSDTAVSSRVEENKNALKPFNVTEINLGFLDEQYRKKGTTTDIEDQVKKKIIGVINDRSHNEHLNIYFPAYFGPKITHKDHLMIHDIALDLIKSGQFHDVSWYMYEDMPYTLIYYKKHKEDLFDYLKQNTSGFELKEKDILLSFSDLDMMSKSIQSYTSQVKAFKFIGNPLKRVVEFAKTHCKDGACEKVYEVNVKQ